MARNVLTRANLLCNRFEGTNKVALFVHCSFCGIIQVAFIVSVIKEIPPLNKVSNESLALSNVIKVDGDIC